MFCRTQKTCFTSEGHCFTQLHLGFTRASLRTKAVLIHRFNAVITCFEKAGYLRQTTVVTRSSITSGRNLRPPWLLGPVSRNNSLNSFFSLYKNPMDLSLNPISSDSDEIGIQTKMFRSRGQARLEREHH